MREQREYLIEILQRDYSGDADTLYPTGDVLVITQGSMDANELDPIKSSEATLSLLCIEDGDPYMSLFTTDPLTYKLRVRRKIAVAAKERYINEWEGYLSAGTYSQEYRNAPYRVSLKAVDGLATLKDIPYLDAEGKRYTNIRTLGEIITDILGRISNMAIRYNIGDVIIAPEQESSAMDMIEVDSQALYVSFGDDGDSVPSCYDVLKAILTTLQLQLFQGYGTWRIRSIASLTSPLANRSEDPLVNNGGDLIPIYSDDGDDTGVSTAATLSLCAPYSEIVVERPELAEDKDLLESSRALFPSSWSPCFGLTKLTTAYWKDRLRLWVSIANREATADVGVAYAPSVVFTRSVTSSLTMSFDCYNLTRRDKTIRVGLLAYRATDNITKLFSDSTVYLIVDIPLWYWDVEDKKWVRIPEGMYRWSYQASYPLSSMWSEVQLTAALDQIPFKVPTPESWAVKTELSITADNLDVNTSEGFRVAMLLVGVADDYDDRGVLPTIELRNPLVTSKMMGEIVEDISFDRASVTKYGVGVIKYEQHFGDAWVVPTPGLGYKAPLLNKYTGDVLRGLVTPMKRPLLADNALNNIRVLRGDVARQIDGEVCVRTSLDLNARWHGRDGRIYYTNYIRRHLRRGLYTVQLREIPRVKDLIYIPYNNIGSRIGLDTSMYFTIDNGLAVCRLDIQSGETYEVASSLDDRSLFTINEGQCCVCVINDNVYDDGSIDYTLVAYDSVGKELSRIDNIVELLEVLDITMTGQMVDEFARSARYDSNVQMWTLINDDTTITSVLLINSFGEFVAKKDYGTGYIPAGYTGHILIPNGFICRIEANGVVKHFWHSNSQHKDAEVEIIPFRMDRVYAVNEHLIAYEADSLIKICRRTDLLLGFDDTPLIEFDSGQYTFVAMNNALVVVYGADSVEVYDARTGRVVHLGDAVPSWLSGDLVCRLTTVGNGSQVEVNRILLGDGEGYAVYTTSDGEHYVTCDDELYLTIK